MFLYWLPTLQVGEALPDVVPTIAFAHVVHLTAAAIFDLILS